MDLATLSLSILHLASTSILFSLSCSVVSVELVFLGANLCPCLLPNIYYCHFQYYLYSVLAFGPCFLGVSCVPPAAFGVVGEFVMLINILGCAGAGGIGGL